jgi:hypothetical protein
MANSNLTDEIKQAQKWQSSRYAIDKELLEKGYVPDDIDKAWQETGAKSLLKKKFKALKFVIIMLLWLCLILVLLAVFQLPSMSISPINFAY